jgi:3-oxoacyl-[acyl-carrier-protein] synthase-3
MARVAKIISTGRYIPEKVITHDDLNAMLGENVGDWLTDYVGIHERHFMAEDEATSDLIVQAAR